MKTMRGLCALAGAFSILSSAVAADATWKVDIQNSYRSKVTRDATGNLFVVSYQAASSYNANFRVMKISPQGNVIFDKTPYGNSQMEGSSYRIDDLATFGSHLYITARVMNGPNADFAYHYLMDVNSSTGELGWIRSDPSNEGLALDVLASGVPVVCGVHHGATDDDDRAFVRGYNVADGSTLWKQEVGGGRSAFADIAVDGYGCIFLAGTVWTSGVKAGFVYECGETGAYKKSGTFSKEGWSSLQGEKIILKEDSDRVYVAGSGQFVKKAAFAALLYKSSLTPVSISTLSDGGDDVYLTAFAADNTGVFFGASQSDGLGEKDVIRHTTTQGEILFTKVIHDAYYGDRAMTLDAGGDLFYAYLATGMADPIEVIKFDGATGDQKLDFTYSGDGPNAMRDMVSDPAGNLYILGSQNGGDDSYLIRVQQATLDLPASVVGGAQAVANLSLINPAPGGGAKFDLASNKAAATVQPITWVSAGSSSKSFFVSTQPVVVDTAVTINAKYDHFVVQKQFVILAPSVAAITLTDNAVIGGTNVAGTAKLTGKAATGGVKVLLSSSDSSAASVPASVWVTAGSSSAGFTVTTKPVSSNKSAVISATVGGATKTIFLAVNAPWMTNIAVNPTVVKGGVGSSISLTLNGPAPANYAVKLISGAPGLVTVPGTVQFTAGTTVKSIPITTHPVLTSTTITLVAYKGQTVVTTTITLTP